MEIGTSKGIDHWNRKILNCFWICILLITIIEMVSVLAFDQKTLEASMLTFVVIPTIFLVLIQAAAEIIIHRIKKHKEYLILFIALLMATTLVYIHSDLRAIPMIYFLPLFIAISYLDKKLVYIVTAGGILSYLITFLTNPYLGTVVMPYDIATTALSLIIGGYLSIKAMERGIGIYESYLRAQKDSQELLIKNTIMDKMLKIDALTEMYNHMSFHEYLDSLIEQNHVNNLSLQLALIDIDDFKKVNDTFGHKVGDSVLKNIAAVIKHSIGANDFAARYGGEEFAILFVDRSLVEAYGIAEDIRKKIAELNHIEANSIQVTISIGLQSYGKNGKDRLFRDADDALYYSKKHGKNQTRLAA